MTMFKSVINGIESFFHFDSTCTTEIAKLALLDAIKWIGQIEDNAKAAQEAQAAQKQVLNEAEDKSKVESINLDPDIKPLVDIP